MRAERLRYRDTLRDLVWLTGGRFMAAGLGFLGVSLVARGLDPADLGLWSMALAAQGYLLHLSEMGLRSVATAESGLVTGRWRSLLKRYLALRLAAALTLAVLGTAAAFLVVPESFAFVVVVLLSLPLIALQLDWVPLAEGQSGRAGALLLVRPLGFLLLLLVLPPPLTLLNVALAWTGAWGLAAAATWPGLPAGPASGAPPAPWPLLRRGLPLMGVTFLNQAQANLDLLLAGVVLAPEAAGRLYLALAVLTAALMPANALGQLALARTGRHGGDLDALRAALCRDAERLAWITTLIGAGIALAGPRLLPLWFGEAHAAAGPLLAWLTPWLLLQAQSTLLQHAHAALGRSGALLRINLQSLLLGVPLLLPALLTGRLELLVLARVAAEAGRLALLARLLDPALRGPWARTLPWPALLLVGAALFGGA